VPRFPRSVLFALLVLPVSTLQASLPPYPTSVSDINREPLFIPAAAHESRAAQRELFMQAESALNSGNVRRYEVLSEGLRDYPLLPYLELRALQRRLFSADSDEVIAVLEKNSEIPLSRTIRHQWLAHLGNSGKWQLLKEHGNGNLRGIRLQCQAISARIKSGDDEILAETMPDIWLNGQSLPNACDPLLRAWRDQGGLTDQLTWDRMVLALKADNANLANYLRRYLSSDLREQALQLLDVHHQPSRLERRQDFMGQDKATADIIGYGMLQYARSAPEKARLLWPYYEKSHAMLDPDDQLAVEKTLGLRLAVRYDKAAPEWLKKASARDDDRALEEWQVRVYLRHEKWDAVADTIENMSDELRESARWQYWLARAEEALGYDDQAHARFQGVAQQRNFYGFLAADRVGSGYHLNHQAHQATTEELAEVVRLPGIQRAYELFQLGRLHHARSEWRSALNGQERHYLLAASELAQSWGWHEQSVMGTIAASAWDDLNLRFPLAYQDYFGAATSANNIDINWVYALARQESAFMKDARSSKGALGILQLLPATAGETARDNGLSYSGQGSLLDPETNIQLGTAHLAGLLEGFDGNRILATAAYNAGEHRVRTWLKNGARDLDSDIWVETMPFYETRQYVQNVMAYTIIYGYRRGQPPTRFLTQRELACACVEQ